MSGHILSISLIPFLLFPCSNNCGLHIKLEFPLIHEIDLDPSLTKFYSCSHPTKNMICLVNVLYLDCLSVRNFNGEVEGYQDSRGPRLWWNQIWLCPVINFHEFYSENCQHDATSKFREKSKILWKQNMLENSYFKILKCTNISGQWRILTLKIIVVFNSFM